MDPIGNVHDVFAKRFGKDELLVGCSFVADMKLALVEIRDRTVKEFDLLKSVLEGRNSSCTNLVIWWRAREESVHRSVVGFNVCVVKG